MSYLCKCKTINNNSNNLEIMVNEKKFPIFWACVEDKGMKSIHQVRFITLLVKSCYHTNSVRDKSVEVAMSVFQIAGLNGIFVGSTRGNSENVTIKKYFDLSKVFSTRELAEAYAKNASKIGSTQFYNIDNESYKITQANPLLDCEWSWDKHIPTNTKIIRKPFDVNGNKYEYLGGYSWDGVKTDLYRIFIRGEVIDLGNGIEVKNDKKYAFYDMVTNNWIGDFIMGEYYATREECDNKHQIKVYEFND